MELDETWEEFRDKDGNVISSLYLAALDLFVTIPPELGIKFYTKKREEKPK